jgi:23S rRNA G2069 N7-methylase RlmK/C1962 C5-methylase RlmI
MIEVRLRPGVEKKIKAFFQWVYNLEIEDINGSLKPGDLVKVLDSKKEIFGLRIHKPKHQDNGQTSLFQRGGGAKQGAHKRPNEVCP